MAWIFASDDLGINYPTRKDAPPLWTIMCPVKPTTTALSNLVVQMACIKALEWRVLADSFGGVQRL